MTIGLSLLFFAALLATAEPQAALAGKPQRLLLQVPPRTTGLDYRDKWLRSSPNTTRRNYFVSRGKAAQIRTLGAGTNSTQIARAACNTTNVMDPQLFPRVDCAFGATYSDFIDSFVRAPVSSWAARSCYLYTGSADGDCARASACANQLPPGVSLSWAYDANALNTMAKV
ncbi:hypothetical protein OEZ85_014385 [Tetradesmus obliquus]|uniref:Uncharacterized protein n=1 Tax=Tetradesmus obliquus TaxID=3088 RepID=A0ABY8UA97_TETOB|nr:hypothetical protein OEZ85_014385 [Tetradesmus obliquus]